MRRPLFPRAALGSLTAVIAGIGLASLAIAAAPDPAAAPSASARPRIGLVLAGGGAKGGAHVGVLKVLEQMHVPVDCIAGTSMGALVGAGYASGIPADELEKFLVGINWKSVVGGEGRRELEPIEQKRDGVTYSNQLELGLRKGGVIAPAGLVNTSNIEDLLRSYVATARMQSSFDKLPIPYRAVATDMVTGQMVVLDKGDIATAMRASMAIPGAFAPVVMDKMILSDGGLVRNIPVDVARDLCADVVIVVNLVEPAADPAKLQTATQLMGRMSDVMIQANEELQLRTLTDRDVRIDVVMGDIGTADFERVPDTIPLGEKAAREQMAALAKYAVPVEQYTAWRQKVTASQAIEARLAGVRYEGMERVNPAYLATIAQVHAGDVVDTAQISAEAQRMSALQDFESVEYRLEGDPASPTLVWLPHEKRHGPDYLKVDLGMYASAGGDVAFSIYGKHNRNWINSLGAEWRNEVQLGGESLVSTSLYQPLDAAHHFFVEPRLFWKSSREDVFHDNDRLATYRFDDTMARLDFGANIGSSAQARVGYVYDRRKVDLSTGSPLLPETNRNDAGLIVEGTYDSRDTAFNPTRGLAVALEYMRSDESLGADLTWDRAELGIGLAVPLRRDVLWVTVAGGSDLGSNLPPDRAFALGGPGSFPGFELGEMRVGGYWTAGTGYLWKFKDMMTIRGQALYAGIRLEAGSTYNRIDGENGDDIYSGSLYLTGRTLVGPLTVGVGTTNTDSWAVWVSVGRPIGRGTILEKGIFR
ncbi:MAG TPA: patatin-like phospholipase family protein [Steroidobacteraceae bacterium]